MIYQFDADAAPDSDFARGRLADLVVGNRARLLDPRRTPVTIVGLSLDVGVFAARVEAFEDAGAVWELPFEDVGRLQFALGGAVTDPTELADVVARLDHPLVLEAGPAAEALARIAEEREAAREWVQAAAVDFDDHVTRGVGEPALYAALAGFMRSRGVAELERAFAERYVSNPQSGELVKGHAIVLAELGLCPFAGKAVRDPQLFSAAWSKPRRATHLLARMAFVQELWGGPVTLFRGGRSFEPPPASFVSATFSRAVAEAHFEASPPQGLLWRHVVPVERLFMTFLETEAMNAKFHEAEAVVLGPRF